MVTVDGHPVGAPAWFELMAHDGAAARDFYAPLFGWGVQAWLREHGDYLVCALGERAVAGIDEPTGPHAAVPTGWLVYFHVTDVRACAERIPQAGGRLIAGPTELVGAGTYLMARDPLGAVFGLWEPHGHIGSGAVGEPGTPSWTELRLAPDDRQAAIAFYTAILGVSARATDGSDGLCAVLLIGGRRVAGVRATSGLPPRWIPFFGAARPDAAGETLSAAGGRVREAVTTPLGSAVLAADRDGADFGVLAVDTTR